VRQAVNKWIRESGAYDGVADFDAVVRDPANPKHIKAEFDSGDHLHPNDAGYVRMGERFHALAFGAGRPFAVSSEP
jgi:lysophospholipase L1-like esterase